MGRICLVRHGETDWNKKGLLQGQHDIPLNDKGKSQAKKTGNYLKTGNWNHIVSSPQKRAKETAEIIAEALGFDKVVLDNKLRERNYGDASGKPIVDRSKLFSQADFGGVEPWDTLQDRIYTAVKNIITGKDTDNIILVSHGGAINSLLYKLSDGEYGTISTLLRNGHICILNYNENEMFIETLDIEI